MNDLFHQIYQWNFIDCKGRRTHITCRRRSQYKKQCNTKIKYKNKDFILCETQRYKNGFWMLNVPVLTSRSPNFGALQILQVVRRAQLMLPHLKAGNSVKTNYAKEQDRSLRIFIQYYLHTASNFFFPLPIFLILHFARFTPMAQH